MRLISPTEKLYIIEILTESLSEPDKKIEDYWKEEVEQRYLAYTKGEIKSIPYNDIRKNDN